MSSRKIKNKVISLLGQQDLDQILYGLQQYPDKDLINPLFLALPRAEELVRWHAVSAFGQVVPRIAEEDMEAARIVMRRFLWSLNDESGGIGWGSAEAMAEIMAHHEPLADEYLHMLHSYIQEDGEELFQDGNHLELPQLQRGILWGIGRVAPRWGARLLEKGVVDHLRPYLQSDDAVVRAMTIRALVELKAPETEALVSPFLDDDREVRFYLEGVFQTLTVADFCVKSHSV